MAASNTVGAGMSFLIAQSIQRPSPRTGAAAAPVALPGHSAASSPRMAGRGVTSIPTAMSTNSLGTSNSSSRAGAVGRSRSHSSELTSRLTSTDSNERKMISDASMRVAKTQSRSARKLNDSLVYLDGPQVYTCAECRTHLTSHDEIISKSFQGRHGRAYLFDNCVNVTLGPAEDRRLITGLHSVCDIFCKRCETLVGWTYAKAYENSQKYKEGKFIIEKINLHLEESDYFDVAPPAGERQDRFRARSISWGKEPCSSRRQDLIYEYLDSSCSSRSLQYRAKPRNRQGSVGSDISPQTP